MNILLSIHDFTVMFNLSLRLLTQDLNHNETPVKGLHIILQQYLHSSYNFSWPLYCEKI